MLYYECIPSSQFVPEDFPFHWGWSTHWYHRLFHRSVCQDIWILGYQVSSALLVHFVLILNVCALLLHLWAPFSIHAPPSLLCPLILPPHLPPLPHPWLRRELLTLTTGGCRPSLTTSTAHPLSAISTPSWSHLTPSSSLRMYSRFCKWSMRQMSSSWVLTPMVTFVSLSSPLPSWSLQQLSSKWVLFYPHPPTTSLVAPTPPLSLPSSGLIWSHSAWGLAYAPLCLCSLALPSMWACG